MLLLESGRGKNGAQSYAVLMAENSPVMFFYCVLKMLFREKWSHKFCFKAVASTVLGCSYKRQIIQKDIKIQ